MDSAMAPASITSGSKPRRAPEMGQARPMGPAPTIRAVSPVRAGMMEIYPSGVRGRGAVLPGTFRVLERCDPPFHGRPGEPRAKAAGRRDRRLRDDPSGARPEEQSGSLPP